MIPPRRTGHLALLVALASLSCNENIPMPDPEPIRPPPEPRTPPEPEKVQPSEPGIPLSRHTPGRKHLSRKQRKQQNILRNKQ